MLKALVFFIDCEPKCQTFAFGLTTILHPAFLILRQRSTSSYIANIFSSNSPVLLKIDFLINPKQKSTSIISLSKNLKEFLDKEIIEVDFYLVLIKKSIFNKTGLFDEKIFAMYEEVDLCRRIKNAGCKIVVNPKAKVWHFGSQSIKKTSAFRIYYSYRNRLRYVLKHNKGFNKLFYGKILCLIYFYKMLKFSFKGRFDFSWAILKGIGWDISNLGDY